MSRFTVLPKSPDIIGPDIPFYGIVDLDNTILRRHPGEILASIALGMTTGFEFASNGKLFAVVATVEEWGPAAPDDEDIEATEEQYQYGREIEAALVEWDTTYNTGGQPYPTGFRPLYRSLVDPSMATEMFIAGLADVTSIPPEKLSEPLADRW